MEKFLQVVDTILERTSVDSMKESVNKSAFNMFRKMNMPLDNLEDMKFVRKGVVSSETIAPFELVDYRKLKDINMNIGDFSRLREIRLLSWMFNTDPASRSEIM